MRKLQVDILGLSTSPHTNGAYALILYEIEGKRKLPIIIGGFEAQAIALKLENIKPPRPFTHDLFKNISDAFGLHVNEIFIDELHNETFYAKVICELNGEIHEIDARPSDAIAIAVRFNAPVFVSEEIMDEAGIKEEQKEAEDGDAFGEPGETEEEPEPEDAAVQLKSPESKLEELQVRLDDAVKREDYEEAARLRDEISRLKGIG
ncbi:MAG: bifunctional nuclease family protein [Chlorobium sp.]|uniref:bifunctional nuclease family protein n=1 Tax=Chlorobium sp. TaxID=1095 RepID=UPI0025C67A4D|nr:bifunctional nuclease family protein [Chlorobium sp.]MCF8215348.1 bifunctional nuclease family protein [Chlorobium sp.]MCF8270186.1 bifunctional nuclease family protein [Chlorobium sp.]MCF8286555.1 bifunctional nuclease family protein [Chlorobium sp.]MCF8290154.1 bifunctional nuclease family protein [Chlorobium sp.]MCF8384313.1 bifunctional nuclease family protein [Chlorobium sp.]